MGRASHGRDAGPRVSREVRSRPGELRLGSRRAQGCPGGVAGKYYVTQLAAHKWASHGQAGVAMA